MSASSNGDSTASVRLAPDPLRDHLTGVCDHASCSYCKKRRRIADEGAGKPPLDDECLTCGDPSFPLNECPESRRQCGHHCNCSWVHDHCHWCDAEFGEDTSAWADSAMHRYAREQRTVALDELSRLSERIGLDAPELAARVIHREDQP